MNENDVANDIRKNSQMRLRLPDVEKNNLEREGLRLLMSQRMSKQPWFLNGTQVSKFL